MNYKQSLGAMTHRLLALVVLWGALCALVPTQALAQSGGQTIKGKVLDELGEPLMGASVRVVGASVGTSVKLNGEFTITLPPGKKEISVSFIGYIEQKLEAKNGMVIKMKPDSKALKEVVVTGMVATDKRLFTGASDKLSASKVKLDGVPDISRALEGRSAGVSVQNVSGTFGAAPKIRVRGASSIYGASKPLWVVDGVIQEDVVEIGADDLSSGDATTLISSAIAGLNPDDIESFQILKDGSATSIYGAKAMAGVIVITTKKGQQGQSSFSYTGEFTSRLVPTYREFNIMNSQEQMDFYLEMKRKGWLTLSSTYRAANSGVFGKMYHDMNTFDPETKQFKVINDAVDEVGYLRAAELRNTDWFAELFSPAVMMNHSVSMSTGTERSQTYVSMSAMLDPGWMKASKVNRYTGNFNNTYNITPRLSVTTLGGMSYRQQKAPGTFAQNSDAISGTVSRAFDINPYSYAINTSRTLDPKEFYQRNYAPFNIGHELDNNLLELDVFDVKFQGELKWKPLSGLTLAALGAVKYNGSFTEHKIKDKSNMSLAYRAMDDATMIENNSWLYKDPDQPNTLPYTILPQGGIYNTRNYKMLSYDFRASATYNTEIDGKHIINTYAGIEFNAQNRMSNSFSGWGLQYEAGETPFWVYDAFKQMVEQNTSYYDLYNSRVRTNAVFGTATYSYRGKYTVTGTARYEGSNRLGRSMRARWLPTWNVAAAWNMHEEEWFKQQEVLSHLTLKSSYSLTADAGPSSNSLVYIKSDKPFRAQAHAYENRNYIAGYENEDLTYEKKHELNVGVDLGFFNDRINLTADVYRRNNFDLMGYIATTSGDRFGNSASMRSQGIEFSLSTTNIKHPGFSWVTDFIFGFTETEIIDLRTSTYLFSFVSGSGFARVGYPVRSLFSIPFTGLDSQGFPTFMYKDQKVGRDNYGIMDLREVRDLDFLKYEGATDPVYTGSFGNILTMGDFRLNLFITYSGGNKLRLDPAFSLSYSDLTASPREMASRWAMLGDEEHTDIPVLASTSDSYNISDLGRAYNVYNYSSARVADGSFVRLKEVSLTYNVPQRWLKDRVLKSASVKLQATNLLLLYADPKLNGQDPEFFRAGGVSAPVPKQLTATLRIGF